MVLLMKVVKCGDGGVLKFLDGTISKLSLGCGKGTNARGGLLSLWSLLQVVHLERWKVKVQQLMAQFI